MQTIAHGIAAAALTALLLTGCGQKAESPTAIINHEATFNAATLPANPLAWNVVTSFNDPVRHTMATLYGNEAAVQHARLYTGEPYPGGAVLALVTWGQQEDTHWFGARIPAQPLRIEYVFVGTAHSPSPLRYARYEGNPLQAKTIDQKESAERTSYLVSQHAALMP